jgi:hypothetical protein
VNVARQSVELRAVLRILLDIEAGKLALANFQRDFDWSDRDSRSLLATLLMGWPAGSVLLLRGDGSARVGGRAFADAPPAHAPEWLVLDGQQRLTALFHALTDKGPVVHAIKLSALVDGSVEEFEDGFRTFSRTRWDDRLRNSPWLDEEFYLPVYALRDSSSFFAFRDLVGQLNESRATTSWSSALSHAWRQVLARVSGYEFPVVLIEAERGSGIDDASVARIFERVNRTGQRLGAFDLVVARTYSPASPRSNLRDLWEEARLSNWLIDEWLGDDGLAEDGMPMLQALALRGPKHDVRQSAVLDLDPGLIADQWPRAVNAVERTLEFLSERCGVLRFDWLPYRAVLVTLAAIALDHDLIENGELVERWFWTRCFSLRFESAANTRTVEEYIVLKAAIAEGKLQLIEPLRFEPLMNATRRRFRALYRAVLCLIAVRDRARVALERDAPVTGKAFGLNPEVVLASLLPRHPDTDLHLRIMSMVLVPREVAQLIGSGGYDALARVAPGIGDAQLAPRPIYKNPRLWIEGRALLIAADLEARTGQPRADYESDRRSIE